MYGWLETGFQATKVSVKWAEGPRGTCLVIYCSFPPSVTPPSSFCFNHKTYKGKQYTFLPSAYRFYEKKEYTFEKSLLDCFTALQAGSPFPAHLERAVLSVLTDSDPAPNHHSSVKRASIDLLYAVTVSVKIWSVIFEHRRTLK